MKVALYIKDLAATNFVTIAKINFDSFYSTLIARGTDACPGESNKADDFFLFSF